MQGRDEVYSEKIRAGKRTYFFDVRSTRSNDYYITITESKRRFNGRGYDKHKIFLYKEDFNKFLASLNKTIDHVKTELLPDYDYEEFDRDPETRQNNYQNQQDGYSVENGSTEEEMPNETLVEAEAEAEEELASMSGGESNEVETGDLSTTWED